MERLIFLIISPLDQTTSLSVTHKRDGRFVCLSYQLGPWSLEGLTVLGRFWVKDQMNCTHDPPGWRLGDGLLSHPRKKNVIIETRHTFQDSKKGSVEALCATEREEAR